MFLWVLCLLLLAADVSAQGARRTDEPASEQPSAVQRSIPPSQQRTVAPPQSADSEAGRRRAARRAAAGLMVLVLILVGLMLILMLLTARSRRRRLGERPQPKPTSLEDLWWTVKEETLPKVDVEGIMSEGGEEKQDRPDSEGGKGENS